ncbi:hypothetical protein H5410_001224 [Solanum commersonii]|uniref:Uncharacterized protein n=1 Tax=Solanum commersonii TaxID=4109 RepID=A0A9J6AZ33_SOLCO|nr:hypothetical protein H5410_001224 [Solanum commersonii]
MVKCFVTEFSKNKTNIIGVMLDDSVASSDASSIWLYIVPHGIRSLMNYIKQKYENPLIIITKNGMDDSYLHRDKILSVLQEWINYHNDYLTYLLAAIKEDGCNVEGYFVWSLMDYW